MCQQLDRKKFRLVRMGVGRLVRMGVGRLVQTGTGRSSKDHVPIRNNPLVCGRLPTLYSNCRNAVSRNAVSRNAFSQRNASLEY